MEMEILEVILASLCFSETSGAIRNSFSVKIVPGAVGERRGKLQ